MHLSVVTIVNGVIIDTKLLTVDSSTPIGYITKMFVDKVGEL